MQSFGSAFDIVLVLSSHLQAPPPNLHCTHDVIGFGCVDWQSSVVFSIAWFYFFKDPSAFRRATMDLHKIAVVEEETRLQANIAATSTVPRRHLPFRTKSREKYVFSSKVVSEFTFQAFLAVSSIAISIGIIFLSNSAIAQPPFTLASTPKPQYSCFLQNF